jgi:hypothetical protein
MTISTYNQILELANKYIQKVGFNAFSYSDLANEIGIKRRVFIIIFLVRRIWELPIVILN